MRMESLFLYLAIVYFRVVATEAQEDVGLLASRPEFVGNLKNITVAIGRDAIFSCNVRNLAPFKVGWVRSDSKAILSLQDLVITYDSRIDLSGDFATTFNLHIKGVQKEDRGQYMCQVNTDPMISQTAYLDVNVPPDINTRQTSGDVEAKLGSTVKLRCNADGYPRPTIKWRREDGKLIKITEPSGRTVKIEQFTGSTLTIENLQTDDMGSYLCIADNGVPPIVSKRIYLYVQFAPKVATKAVIGAVEGRLVKLLCDVKAYPKAMVEWMRFDKVVVSNGAWTVNETESAIFSKSKTLKFKAEPDKMGTYVCHASNSIGAATAMAQLYLIERPKDLIPTTEEDFLVTEPTQNSITIREEVEISKDKLGKKSSNLQDSYQRKTNTIQNTKYDTVKDESNGRPKNFMMSTGCRILPIASLAARFFAVLLGIHSIVG